MCSILSQSPESGIAGITESLKCSWNFVHIAITFSRDTHE